MPWNLRRCVQTFLVLRPPTGLLLRPLVVVVGGARHLSSDFPASQELEPRAEVSTPATVIKRSQSVCRRRDSRLSVASSGAPRVEQNELSAIQREAARRRDFFFFLTFDQNEAVRICACRLASTLLIEDESVRARVRARLRRVIFTVGVA